MAQIDIKHATIKIVDGHSNNINVKIGEGNLTFTERKTIEYTLDRGLIDEVREGDQVPMEVSIDAVWEYISSPAGALAPTIFEALKQEGPAADWVSSDRDICRPYAVDLQIIYDPDCGENTVETIILPDFRFEEIGNDLREGTLSVSGRCNAVEPISGRGYPPTITGIDDQSIVKDTATSALAFEIGDEETAVADLVVTAWTDNPILLPAGAIVLAGTTEDRTVTITPGAGLTGTARILLTVTDEDGLTARTGFTLTVTAA
jgi:hypothetical protein